MNLRSNVQETRLGLHVFLAGVALSYSLFVGIFVPCTSPFILARRYSFVSVDPILIFVPFEGSSSSCPCCIEGFLLELLSRMPTLSWGVQWSAHLVWPPLRGVGSLAPAPLLYEGLLPGASLHMPTLSWGV